LKTDYPICLGPKALKNSRRKKIFAKIKERSFYYIKEEGWIEIYFPWGKKDPEEYEGEMYDLKMIIGKQVAHYLERILFILKELLKERFKFLLKFLPNLQVSSICNDILEMCIHTGYTILWISIETLNSYLYFLDLLDSQKCSEFFEELLKPVAVLIAQEFSGRVPDNSRLLKYDPCILDEALYI